MPGFDHSRHLAVNLVLDFIWGIRVARGLPPGDVVICNTVSLPAWLHGVKPSAGRVCVMIGRAPKGQVKFYRDVARIYAPSTFIAHQMNAKWAAERTRVIGYPIEWDRLARSSAQTGGPVTIGFTGRLHPEKGLALLIRAARILATRGDLPAWRLKIVGPETVNEGGGGEDWVAEMRRESSTALESRIEWLGPEFDADRLARLYGSMDIFCYPSLAEKGETFGVAVAEAMAARCAVVVSALGCFGDLVADGDTGLVFDHRASDSDQRLAGCIAQLVSDTSLRKSLATRGQSHVRRFDYEEVSRNILTDLAFLSGAGTEKPQ
jgi:glycosyltransferase involved in cell wall biosynthesis